MGHNFGLMLELTLEMNLAAGHIFFGESRGDAESKRIHERDAEVNALERTIRRQVLTHLAVPGNEADTPYSLLLMSLVKDVERLGDYAKNLSELVEIRPEPLPSGPELEELQAIRHGVEHTFRSVSEVFAESNKDEAMELIRHGREVARRCDRLVMAIGHSDYDAATTTTFILGTRYYKRIGGHVLNVLSSVVMPLDRVDYYDENGGAATSPQDAS
jgi:phosphate uptake regulator